MFSREQKKTVESWKVIKSYKLLLFATHKKSDVMCIGILMFADGFAVEFWLITLEMFRLKSTTTRPPESFLLKMFQFGKSVNQTDVWNIEAINYCKRISAETAKAFLSLIESSIKKTLTSFRSGRARGGEEERQEGRRSRWWKDTEPHALTVTGRFSQFFTSLTLSPFSWCFNFIPRLLFAFEKMFFKSKLGFKDDEKSSFGFCFLFSICWFDAIKTESEMERKHLRTRFRFN